MASTINAIATGAGGIQFTGDSSGLLNLQTSGVNAITIDASQNVNTAAGFTVAGAFSALSLTSTNDSTISGLTVGKGSGNQANNTAVGFHALYANTTGGYANTAFGYLGLASNTTGGYNTAFGASALQNNTTASNNTAVGYQAGYSNTTGDQNTFIGHLAGYSNTTGATSTLVGKDAGTNLTGGSNDFFGWAAGAGAVGSTAQYNAGFGRETLNSLTTGSFNVAMGRAAGLVISSGQFNVAIGASALYNTTTASNNVAVGYQAGYTTTTGINNTAIGTNALGSGTTASFNTAVGMNALNSITTGVLNTAIGLQAMYYNTTGSNNTAIGLNALQQITTGAGNIGIGGNNAGGTLAPAFAITTQNNLISMGSTAVTNAYIQVAWTAVSDARDKTNISTVPHGLAFINQLQPIKYQFKVSREDDTAQDRVHYGFKAQDILALEGDSPVIVDTVDEEKLRITETALIPVLVKAIQEQQAIIVQQQADIATLKAAAGI